jgi:hypothetical protein
MLSFGLLASFSGIREGYWPETGALARIRRWLSIDRGCLIGGAMMALGGVGAAAALASWAGAGFSDMDPDSLMRLSIPSVLLGGIGLQVALTAFVLELLSRPSRFAER